MEPSFLRKCVFSVDHKTIAKQYMLTGLVMAALGGYLSYVFRSQLAWPGEPVPGFGPVGENVYNALVTMHGTIMIFWVAMPILLAGFGNFLIPLMIGTDDMAFPRLNMVSYWTFLASTLLLLASFMVPGGAAAMGWTFYPPLSARPEFTGVIWGGHLWLLAVALEFASMLMGGINFLTTVIPSCFAEAGEEQREAYIGTTVFLSALPLLLLGFLALRLYRGNRRNAGRVVATTERGLYG